MHLIRPLHHCWRRSERGLPIQLASPGGRTRWPAIQLSDLGLDVRAGSHSLCVHDLESASMAHDRQLDKDAARHARSKRCWLDNLRSDRSRQLW